MRILGIGYFVAHDSNIGVISDNGIDFAISEERLSRQKRDGGFPRLALDLVRDTQFDAIVAAYQDSAGFELSHKGIADAGRWARFTDLQRLHEATLREVGVTHFVGHHFSHAAGAYYTSGFSKAIIITYDGGIVCEPWLATVWEATNGTLKPVRKFTRLDGATAAIRYSAVTSLLGFRPVHDEGKVTGLAASGQPDEGCMRFLSEAFDKQQDPATYYNGAFARQFDAVLRKYSNADIAASIQMMTEDAVIRFIKECVPNLSEWDCVLAGGLFANVKLNFRVARMGFRKTYVYPAMGDEGLSVGAAMALMAMRGCEQKPLAHVYFGPTYSMSDILRCLNRWGVRYTRNADVELAAANLLAEGKVVARFDGRCEFGPRALGNRSILYQANDVSVNGWLNKKLGRTETMPFAPVTLQETANEMFLDLQGLERCTPFMTTVVPCSTKMLKLSPAVVHIDGTARPQIISSDVNPSLYRILSQYHSLTGLPSLINTSFNLHGEPIVCTPDDALRSFLRAELDYMVLGDYLVQHPRFSNTR